MKENKQMLLNRISQLSLAIIDTILYLDTHPCDKHALHYYHKVTKAYQEAVEQYEKNYGPLRNSRVTDENEWTWNKGPWPWQNDCKQ